MDDLSQQVFEQATMLQKRYMDGYRAGGINISNRISRVLRRFLEESVRDNGTFDKELFLSNIAEEFPIKVK